MIQINRFDYKIVFKISYPMYSDIIEICEDIKNDEFGLDIGPETCMMFDMFIKNCNYLLWNGRLGAFEFFNFATGTQFISSSIRDVTSSNGVISIVAGGDTVSAIESSGSLEGFTHISTGGGASLKLLSGEELNMLKSWRLLIEK